MTTLLSPKPSRGRTEMDEKFRMQGHRALRVQQGLETLAKQQGAWAQLQWAQLVQLTEDENEQITQNRKGHGAREDGPAGSPGARWGGILTLPSLWRRGTTARLPLEQAAKSMGRRPRSWPLCWALRWHRVTRAAGRPATAREEAQRRWSCRQGGGEEGLQSGDVDIECNWACAGDSEERSN